MKNQSDLLKKLNCVNVGVLVMDADSNVTYFNKYIADLLSLKKNDIVDKNIRELIPSADIAIRECIATGLARIGHKILEEKLSVIGNTLPIIIDNEISGAISLLFKEDILELSLNKIDSFKMLTKELETLYDSTSDGSWLCDGEGTILKLNKAAEMISEVKAEEVIGKKAWDLIDMGLADISGTGQVLKHKKRFTFQQHMTRLNKTLLVTATPVFDDQGNIFRVVVNERDITSLVEMRNELEKTKQIKEQFENELSELRILESSEKPLVAQSKKMKQVLNTALKLAQAGPSNILILGESGVGKGLMASFIHDNSNRKSQPFIKINCAALPESLLEAELFGYEKGAFTGASIHGKIGLLELAQNGTLFLDEIGDMSLLIQAKLLTYMDDQMVRPLGGIKTKKVNCAIVAATNKDLSSMIAKKQFREDLFYRLNTFTVNIPPLKERPEDIIELMHSFIVRYNQTYSFQRKVTAKTIKALQLYSFPGNVRELKSVIKEAVVMSEDDIMDDYIRLSLDTNAEQRGEKIVWEQASLPEQVKRLETQLISQAQKKCKNTREMADFLGVNQSTIVRKMAKYRISPS